MPLPASAGTNSWYGSTAPSNGSSERLKCNCVLAAWCRSKAELLDIVSQAICKGTAEWSMNGTTFQLGVTFVVLILPPAAFGSDECLLWRDRCRTGLGRSETHAALMATSAVAAEQSFIAVKRQTAPDR